MKKTIGRYSIQERLGEGGMGVVFIGYDDYLERRLAIKVLRDPGDESAATRLLREARLAARINHPNVCQIFEVGEDAGQVYIAMELLEGESLAERLTRGALTLSEAARTSLEILSALGELHDKKLVHRDIKPSNVFLTRHGVKLLDFGLARPQKDSAETDLNLTRTGMIVGTPRYMAPEQWSGLGVGPTGDIFSLGILLYEMVTGEPAFPGATAHEIRDAVFLKPPPALAGGPAVLALDRVIQRALEKRPEDRYPSARAMAEDLEAVLRTPGQDSALASARSSGAGGAAPVRRTRRLIAIPFRVLRSDPETDFLSHSLPDAITGTLSGLDSIVVRSSLGMKSSPEEGADLQAFARENGVDLILSGTLLRAGDRLRVTSQLVDADTGAVSWAETVQRPLGDLFDLQDEMMRHIVDSLAIPLTRMEQTRLGRDVPATPRAYELYLRANEETSATAYITPLEKARDLYRSCLEEDPAYAPAWARLGRIYRILGKYSPGAHERNYELARQAFDKALSLNPDLSLAHNFVTYLEMDEGRSLDAMVRLIARGQSRATDPQVFAGLVAVCRLCGLLGASVAAHRRAQRLAPGIRTGVHFTYWMMGDYETAAALDNDDPSFCRAGAPAMLGRKEESVAAFRRMIEGGVEGVEKTSLIMALAAMEGRRDDTLEAMKEVERSGFRDPEGLYVLARALPLVHENDLALQWLHRIVEAGFACAETIRNDPWLDPLHGREEFSAIVGRAEALHRDALAAFTDAAGPRLLGVSGP